LYTLIKNYIEVIIRGGPLEIPGGGGGENSQKKIRAKKNA
jgi:hypothetical protein